MKKDKTEKNEETVGKTEKEKLIDSAKTDQGKFFNVTFWKIYNIDSLKIEKNEPFR